MHRTDEILERIYERDHDTGAFVIAAALENYSGFFNELDPSPFRKRDIDHDLRVFMEDCSSERALSNTLIEGVSMGGWVFLWEAISMFAFRKREVRNKSRHHKRFIAAQIRFSYSHELVP